MSAFGEIWLYFGHVIPMDSHILTPVPTLSIENHQLALSGHCKIVRHMPTKHILVFRDTCHVCSGTNLVVINYISL